MEQKHQLQKAVDLVRGATRIAAFTGAGISAESGIPTYRDSDDSLWSEYDPDKFANIDYFMRDSSLYWRFFRDVRYQAIRHAPANPGHKALAQMERTGRLIGIITQNIDGLHQEGGSNRVIELHGNTRNIDCLNCGARYSMDEIRAQIDKELPPPCRACGGMLKPKVVFFGESLPEQALVEAAQITGTCDLLLAIGSSLVVYPAAAFPERAKMNGAKLIIINKTPTPYDSLAEVVLRESSGEVLPALAAACAEE